MVLHDSIRFSRMINNTGPKNVLEKPAMGNSEKHVKPSRVTNPSAVYPGIFNYRVNKIRPTVGRCEEEVREGQGRKTI